jgi:hypothetical protein
MYKFKCFFDPSQALAVKILRFLYPFWTIVAVASIMYPNSLVEIGNINLTANNLLANEFLFNLSIAGGFITQLIHILMVLLFWQLFKSINRNLAGLILVFGLISVPIAMFNSISLFAANLVISSPYFVDSFTISQAQTLMMFFLNLNEKGLLIAQIFWGLWLFPIAFLIYQSRFFHKIAGHFLIIAGMGYILISFGKIIFPGAASSVFFYNFYYYVDGRNLIYALGSYRGSKISQGFGYPSKNE